MARRKRRVGRRRRRRGGGGLGGIGGDLPLAEGAAAAAVGFVLQDGPDAGSFAAQVQEQINKLPSVGNRTITAGLVLHFANKYTLRNRWLRLGAKAAIIGGMFSLGRKKFVTSDALLGSWENALDADEVSGMISDAEIEGDD